MNNCKALPINERYNEQMLSIMKASPIHAGGLSLYFDKSPDIFKISGLKYTSGEYVGFFIENQLKGFGSLGYFDALVHNRPEKVFTFYHFYLLPEARGKRIPELAINDFFRRVRGTPSVNFGISITLKGNRSAESYLSRYISDVVPPTRIIDQLVVKSILFSKRKKNQTAFKVRNAKTGDIGEIVRLLQAEHSQRDFGIIYTYEKFSGDLKNRNLVIEDYYVAENARGEIQGVCLAWDCRDFRRTTILKYSSGFYPYLAGYKMAGQFFPMAAFPKKGESFNELTITDYAVAGRDPVIMHALLSEIYYRHHNRKYHFMNWASCGSDSLLTAAKGFWHKDIVSNIVFTSLDPERYNLNMRLPYIDIAFI